MNTENWSSCSRSMHKTKTLHVIDKGVTIIPFLSQTLSPPFSFPITLHHKFSQSSIFISVTKVFNITQVLPHNLKDIIFVLSSYTSSQVLAWAWHIKKSGSVNASIKAGVAMKTKYHHILPICTLYNAWQQQDLHQLNQNSHALGLAGILARNPGFKYHEVSFILD